MVGIVSYGFYLPKYRIKGEEIAKVWGKRKQDIERSLMIKEKTVAGIDEDCLTMAVESSTQAFEGFEKIKKNIGAVFVGSESHPYVVNPTSTILADYLSLPDNYIAYDTQFACKAATGALVTGFGLIAGNYIKHALITASDKATGQPHDLLEYSASSASVSLILGKTNLILELVDWVSFSTDTPDFWRREGMRYPSHGGRFTGKPSYFYHIQNAAAALLKKTKLKPNDFKHAVFHMPNGKFPRQVAESLGFSYDQIKDSLTVDYLGNSYSASILMGLVSILNQAKKNDLIFMVSFGSGAGSDGFIFRVTNNIEKRRKKLNTMLNDKKYIDYVTYLRYMNAI